MTLIPKDMTPVYKAMIDRELDLGSFMSFFPPMPPACRDCQGHERDALAAGRVR
jgi:hypothetical protein